MKHFEKYKFKTLIHSPSGLGLTGPNTGRFETPQTIWGPTRDAALKTLQTASFDSHNPKSKNRLPFQFEFPNPKATELRSLAKKLLTSILLRLDQRNRSRRVRWFDFSRSVQKLGFLFSRSEMDLLQEIDDYIKETINESLGLPVSARTLQLKLRVYEDAYFRLRDQHLLVLGKFRQKDILIDRAKVKSYQSIVLSSSFYFPIFLIIWLSFFGVFCLLGGGEYECSGDKEICGGKSKIGSGVCEFGESV